MSDYSDFLAAKAQLGGFHGFTPIEIPDFLFDFQAALVDWAIRKGRAAIFADCGLGKTPMQLVWADNVVRHTNTRVLILTPLAVSGQTVREGHKFGIECSRQLPPSAGIMVTNYERLHHLSPADFGGVVCDESSILKSFDGVRRKEITDFMRHIPLRLLCTATAAPNDFTELGTSSEALGYLGHMDMLSRFFKNDRNNANPSGRMYGQGVAWRFKGHAEDPFWRWVCSWARAVRRPSDMGMDDGEFILPPITYNEHLIDAVVDRDGVLPLGLPAVGLDEERAERRGTIRKRCDAVARIVSQTTDPAIIWCDLNDEGNLLEKIIPGATQVSGADSDDDKERKFMSFVDGDARVLITKPKIGAWGLNFQHCAHVLQFPSHSFEQHYQSIRRCWRFGQKSPVVVDIVTTPGGQAIKENMMRKAAAAEKMFEQITRYMYDAIQLDGGRQFSNTGVSPSWL